MNKTANIVIIGGGISGVAIAYELAKRGAKDIVVIEKDYLCSGATGRCGAGVRMQWGTEANCKLSKYAIERYEHLNDELDYQYDIEFKQGGYLMCAATEKEMSQFKLNIALQNSLGIPSKLITPEQALEIVPYINTDHMIGGTYCPKDGHLNPFHTTNAYAIAAERLGVKIYKHTEVLSIDTKNNKITGVNTNNGYISTNTVINAAGGYSQLVSEMVNIPLPLYSERHEILVTEPVAPLQKPMFMGFAHNIYIQQTPHGSFIMGRGDKDEPRGFAINSAWEFLERMAKTVVKLLPLLGELSVVRQWAGLYNMSPDRQPVYGAVKQLDGYFVAAGFSGHGFMFGPVTGVVIAETVLNLAPTVDVSMLTYDRFSTGKLFIEPSVV